MVLQLLISYTLLKRYSNEDNLRQGMNYLMTLCWSVQKMQNSDKFYDDWNSVVDWW